MAQWHCVIARERRHLDATRAGLARAQRIDGKCMFGEHRAVLGRQEALREQHEQIV